VALLSTSARNRAGRRPAALLGRWVFRLLLAGVLAVGVGYLPYRACGPEGVSRTLRLQRDLEGLEARNRTLQEENHRLRQRVRSLREDRHAVERVARDELGLVRSEDLIFQFE
jgi:cell division protein FtsB